MSITSDSYWISAVNFLQMHLKNEDRLIAPVKFREEFSGAYSYPSTQGKEAYQFDWIVLHKGALEKIYPPFLQEAIEKFTPVFANEVFVILTGRVDINTEKLNPEHLDSLWETVRPQAEIRSEKQTTFQNKLFHTVSKFKNRITASNKQEVISEISGISRHLNYLETEIKRLRKEAEIQTRSIQNARYENQSIYGSSLQNLTPSAFRAVCRAACQTVYLGNQTILCRVLGRYMLYADSEDIGIVPSLCMNGDWEAWITLAIARTLQPNWYCIDVGANHGYYSLLMAGIVGSSGHVLALEPNPKLAQLLTQTLEINGFRDYTTVLSNAVSDYPGETVSLLIPKGRGINASVVRNLEPSDDVVKVETVTLDQLTENVPRVDFIKIDTEGAEESVWRGMQQTIHRNPEIAIVLEFNCGRYPDPKTFLQSIQQAGFILRHIDFDAKTKDLTIEQCLTERPNSDWLLFLQRH